MSPFQFNFRNEILIRNSIKVISRWVEICRFGFYGKCNFQKSSTSVVDPYVNCTLYASFREMGFTAKSPYELI